MGSLPRAHNNYPLTDDAVTIRQCTAESEADNGADNGPMEVAVDSVPCVQCDTDGIPWDHITSTVL